MSSLWAAPDVAGLLEDDAAGAGLRALLVAAADDELILGHRHSEWTGFAPDIESDVALSSIAQDEMGHARVLYEQLAALDGTTADALAFGRPPEAFRNAVLVERENGDWAYSIMRAWLYDRADAIRLAALAASPLGSFAAVARTLGREEKYHLLFSETWLDRLVRAGGEGHVRMQNALAAAWPEALGLFEPTDGVERLVGEKWLETGPAEQRARWLAEVTARLETLSLDVPHVPATGASQASGGRAGHHVQALTTLLDEMTSVWRSDLKARW